MKRAAQICFLSREETMLSTTETAAVCTVYCDPGENQTVVAVY